MPTGDYERFPGLQAGVAEGHRRCSMCRVAKNRECFSVDRRHSPDGLQSICKSCKTARMQQLRKERPEHYKAKATAHYLRHRARKDAYGKKWREKNRDRIAGYALKRLYGLTPEQLTDMRQSQDNRCAICRKQFPKNRKPHTDHDHKTGKVRGLLCGGCNIALGFYEKPGFLTAARAYLQRHRAMAARSDVQADTLFA